MGRLENDGYKQRFQTKTARKLEQREGAVVDARLAGLSDNSGDLEVNDAMFNDNGADAGGVRSIRARQNGKRSGGSNSERRTNDHWRREVADRRGGGRRSFKRDVVRKNSGSDIQEGLWDLKEREYVHLMTELKASSNWLRVIEVYKQAAADDELTLVMYNSTIGALARSPHWRVALSILQEMRDGGLTPDRFTFNSAIMVSTTCIEISLFLCVQ